MATTDIAGRVAVMVFPQVDKGALSRVSKQLGTQLDGKPIGEELGEEITEGAEKETKSGGGGVGAAFGKAVIGGVAALGIGSVIMNSITGELEKEDNTALLASKLGLSPEDAKKYTDASTEVFKQGWGESKEEVNSAMTTIVGSVKGAADMGTEELGKMTTGMLAVSKTFGFEAGEITSSLQSMMSAGIVKDFDEGLDVLTKGLQTGGVKAEDLLDTFREYSGDFARLGLDGKDALGAINGLLDAGVMNTDKAADGFRELFTRIRNGDQTAIDSLKELGLDAAKVQEQFIAGGDAAKEGYGNVVTALNEASGLVKSTAVTNLFGSPGEDFYDAFQRGVPPEAIDSIEAVGGAVDKIEENYSTAGAGLEAFKRTLQADVSSFIASEVMPVLMTFVGWFKDDFVPAVKPAYEGLKSFVGSLGWVVDAINSTIGFVVKFKDVILPLALVFGGMALTIKAITLAKTAWVTVTGALTAAQIGLNLAMKANPIGLVIGLVVGLVAGFIYLWQNVEGFRNFFIGAWEGIKSILGGIFDWLGGTVVPGIAGFFAAVGSGAMEVLGNIGGFFSGIANWVAEMKTNLIVTGLLIWRIFSGQIDNLKQGFGGVAGFVKGAFEKTLTIIKGVINAMIILLNRPLNAINGIRITIPKWVPKIGGASWAPKVPVIPSFADGGVVPATPGGQIIRVAERGQPERILNEYEYQNMRQALRSTADRGGRREEIRQTFNIQGENLPAGDIARKVKRYEEWSR